MAASANYKLEKQAFVADNAGDTIFGVNKVCCTAITTYVLWKAVIPILPYSYRKGWPLVVIEYSVLVLPLLLGVTVLAEQPVLLNVGLVVFALGCRWRRAHNIPPYARPSESSPKIPTSPHPRSAETPVTLFSGSENDDHAKKHDSADPSQDIQIPLPSSIFQKSFVSVWRAHMMLMTIICILAVDFPIFPRGFGKCESWGTSLMDIGVGSFVFSLGFVASSPFVQRIHTFKRYTSVSGALRRSAAVLALGLVRLAMVKGTEYPEHVTEYGVHWNFFFTLGLLPLAGLAGERLWHIVSFRTQALCVTALHTLILLGTPLQAYTLNDKRPNILAQNKEGLVSFIGYLAIYLLGADTGLYTLPPDPYFAYRPLKKASSLKPKLGKLMNVLFSYAIVWWALFGIVHMYFPESFAVSRRLANSAYVLWIAAFNVTFIMLYLMVDEAFKPKTSGPSLSAPSIFLAINKNGLVVFLVANLLTGLVNVSIKTMYASTTTAIAVLVAYTAASVAAAWLLKSYRIKL